VKKGEINGKYSIFYQSGSLKATYLQKNDLIDSAYVSYHENNQINEQGDYKDNLLTGKWKIFHPNGTLESTGLFAEGNKIGEWNYFYSNGVRKRSEEYGKEYMLDGITKWFDWDGKIYSERNYRKDSLIGYKCLAKSGEIIVQESDENGNYPFSRYHSNEALYSKGQLIGGKLDGPYTTYYDNSKVFQEGTMKADQWHGKYKEYYDHGNLESVGTYKKW